MFASVRIASIGCLGLVSLATGCGPKLNQKWKDCCPRHHWYYDKSRDLQNTTQRVDKAQRAINEALRQAAIKLGRSLPADYLFEPEATQKCGQAVERSRKRVLAVVDIYLTDQSGMRMLEGYVTDYLVNGMLTDPSLGENLRVGERHRLRTIMSEHDLRASRDFDARDAILRGTFRGADAVLVGSIYTVEDKYLPNKKGEMKKVMDGSCSIILRMLDTKDADVVASAVEAVRYSPLIADWKNRVSITKY